MGNNEINNAKKVLEEISQDERERRLTELREKYRMDQNAIMKAGYEKGLKTGIEQEKKEIAKKMLKMGMTIEQVLETTGLTKDEAEKIKNMINQ